MASVLYPSFKALLLTGGINLSSDTIKVVLVDTTDVAFSSAHDFLNDLTAGIEETSAALTGKTTTGGVFDADNVTLTAASGDPSEALVLFKDTGSAATSPLICFIDTGTGLPVTLNGGDVVISWAAGGIFAL